MLVPAENEEVVKAEVERVFALAKAEFADTDPAAKCIFEKQTEPYTSYIEDNVRFAEEYITKNIPKIFLIVLLLIKNR